MVDKIKNLQLKSAGFTIVEVLVVIVILGVVAGITITGYNAIKKRSYQANLESALHDAGSKLQKYNRENGTYPATQANFESVVKASSEVSYLYVASPAAEYYCLAATSLKGSTGTYRLVANKTVENNNCTGYTFPSETITSMVSAPANVTGVVTDTGTYDSYNDYSVVRLSWTAASTSSVGTYETPGCTSSTVANTGTGTLSCTSTQIVYPYQTYGPLYRSFSVRAVAPDGITKSSYVTVTVQYN